MTRSLVLVALILVTASSVQAQQRSLFGNRGPLAGPNGFATGSMGVPPAVQSRSVGTVNRYQSANSIAPTGIFNRQGGNTFGSNGLVGSFSQSLVRNREAPASFNRGLFDEAGVVGVPEEGFPVTDWSPIAGVPAAPVTPSLPAVFPPVEVPVAPADLAPSDGGEIPTAAAPASRAVRPDLRATGQANQAPRTSPRTRSVARHVRKLSRQERFRDVTIGLEGGVWTLRGEVDSVEAWDLAVAFAILEPGVGQVRNEIVVRGVEPEQGE